MLLQTAFAVPEQLPARNWLAPHSRLLHVTHVLSVEPVHGTTSYSPTAHAEQLRHWVAPLAFWKVSPTQSSHAELPAAAVKVPTLHCWHASALPAPRLGFEVPGGHGSAVALVLPAPHQCPSSHDPTHCALVCPGASPYRP